MPLRSKVSQIGGALYSAGSAAITTYKERKQQQQQQEEEAIDQGTRLSSNNVNSGDHAKLLEASNEHGRKQPELYEILSSLIEGVYAADRGNANASLYWEDFGYEKEALQQDEAATDEEIAAVGNPSCKIRLMVFRRRDLDEALPKVVIAIRGTRKFCQRDILADLQILCETLHHNPLFDVVKIMTRRVVQKHSHEKVCVAGHSLGAAIGLLVTRELALEDMAVETHLFNPPFFSLETLMEKVTKGIDKLNQALGSRVTKLAKAKKAKRDAEYMGAMAREFTKLEKWAPSLYVNPYDWICNGYIDYFRNQSLFYGGRETLAVSLTAGSLRRFMSLDSHSYHLIPAAHLWINHRGGNVLQSHPLVQWHHYPTVDLQHEKHDLLAAQYCAIAASENLLRQPGGESVEDPQCSRPPSTNSDSQALNCSVASKAATVKRRGVSSDETVSEQRARDEDENLKPR